MAGDALPFVGTLADAVSSGASAKTVETLRAELAGLIDKAVTGFVALVAKQAPLLQPPGYPTIFLWRGTWRVGAVQPMPFYPVAFVSVTSFDFGDEFIAELRRRMPEIAEVTVDPALDFTGRGHFLRVEGKFAGIMTAEQTTWVLRNAPAVLELPKQPTAGGAP